MQLRAIIVDDEQKGIDTLQLLINYYVKDVKVVASSSSAKEAIRLIEDYKPEIVFLDINMPEMNGFELLEKLQWKEFSLIFTTAHQEYALKALKNDAIDYLLKPIDSDDLSAAIDRVILNFNRTNEEQSKFNYNELLKTLQYLKKQNIVVNSRTGIESIEAQDIIYLESQSNYTRIFLKHDRELLTSKTLKEYESQLCNDDTRFMRIHNSYIVNLNQVTRYLKSSEMLVMSNDQKVPLAKSRKDAFFEWLNV